MKKSKGGRPKQTHNKTQTVAVRLTEREYEALSRRAAGRPVSSTLRALAFAAQKRQGSIDIKAKLERWQALGASSESLARIIRKLEKQNNAGSTPILDVLNRVLNALEEYRIVILEEVAS
ncbi:MAG: hypothetical protein HWD81_05080 [Marivivens sp.]|nr:hypothetical protein [Marivivens sp.]